MTMIKRRKNVLTEEDATNVVEWIQGKAKLKEGLAFPPDFLKRDFTKPTTKAAIIKKVAKEKDIPVKEIKKAKVNPKDLKGNIKKLPSKPKPKPDPMPVAGPVIRVLKDDFGHKPGSLAATKSSGFKDGMTVAEYKAIDLGIGKGWQSGHLKNMVRRGFVKIEG